MERVYEMADRLFMKEQLMQEKVTAGKPEPERSTVRSACRLSQ